MDDKLILEGIITAYRQLIFERYQYEYLHDKHDLPTSFDKDKVDRFRSYFLNNIYPDVQKRNELNEAFESLDSYIKQPEKLLRLLMDSAGLLFKYGRHLPKILTAGLKAMRSFRAATTFENQLVGQAKQLALLPPYTADTMNTLLRSLDRKEMDYFVDQSKSLFEILHDRELVIKIKDIVSHLIVRMKKQPKYYSETEVNGLELGKDIIVKGDTLFTELTTEDKFHIFEFVINLEAEVIEDLFA